MATKKISKRVIRANLRGTKTLTLEEFRDIIRAQIELMNKEAENYKEISSKTVIIFFGIYQIYYDRNTPKKLLPSSTIESMT